MNSSCVEPLAWPSVSQDWSRPDFKSKWTSGVCYRRCGVRVIVPMKVASTAVHAALSKLCGGACIDCGGCNITAGLVRDTSDRARSMYNHWLGNRVVEREELVYLTSTELDWLRPRLGDRAVDSESVRWRFSRFLDWLGSEPWLCNTGRPPHGLAVPWTAKDSFVSCIRRQHFWPQARHFRVGGKDGALHVDLLGRVEELTLFFQRLAGVAPEFHQHYTRTAGSSLPWSRRSARATCASMVRCPAATATGPGAGPRDDSGWKMLPCLVTPELCFKVRRVFAIDEECLTRPLEQARHRDGHGNKRGTLSAET